MEDDVELVQILLRNSMCISDFQNYSNFQVNYVVIAPLHQNSFKISIFHPLHQWSLLRSTTIYGGATGGVHHKTATMDTGDINMPEIESI